MPRDVYAYTTLTEICLKYPLQTILRLNEYPFTSLNEVYDEKLTSKHEESTTYYFENIQQIVFQVHP